MRVPAAWNDLVGLKTTHGLLPLDGVVPLCPRFDTVGPLCRSVEDAALLLAALSGRPAPDLEGARARRADGSPSSTPRPSARPAPPRRPPSTPPSAASPPPAPASSPSPSPSSPSRSALAACVYGRRGLRRLARGDRGATRADVRARSASASAPAPASPPPTTSPPGAALDAIRAAWSAATAGFDAVLLPTTANLPPSVERCLGDPGHFAEENLLALRNTRIGSMLGLCALTLPTGIPSCGLMAMAPGGADARPPPPRPRRSSGRWHSAPQNAGPRGTCRLQSPPNGAPSRPRRRGLTMQFPARFSDLPEYAFPRLRRLLEGIDPGRARARHDHRRAAAPAARDDRRHRRRARRTSSPLYPPNDGTPELRAAIAAWLARRYGVTLDPDTQVVPLNGTREGLFNAAIALSPETKGRRPPGHPDAEPLLPGLRRRRPRRRRRAGAGARHRRRPAFSPTTPPSRRRSSTGSPSATSARPPTRRARSPTPATGARLIALAERHDFRILADECYAEIYRDTPPPGALEIAAAAGADPERVVIFNSLSKRSNAPGLRSGFAAGGPALDRRPAPAPRLRRRAAAAAHPARLDRALAGRGARRAPAARSTREVRPRRPHARQPARLPRRPQAGFFLWLRGRRRRGLRAPPLPRDRRARAARRLPRPRDARGRRTPARTTSAWRSWPTPPRSSAASTRSAPRSAHGDQPRRGSARWRRTQEAKRRAPLMESDTERALRRRGAELVGLLLLALAALAATMIWTYSPDDPSLFSATDEAPRNALGLVGASLADPLHRALGWAAYGIAAAFAVWGLRFLLHAGESRVLRRAIVTPVALLVAADLRRHPRAARRLGARLRPRRPPRRRRPRRAALARRRSTSRRRSASSRSSLAVAFVVSAAYALGVTWAEAPRLPALPRPGLGRPLRRRPRR